MNIERNEMMGNDDVLKQISEELQVDVELLEERLEMVGVALPHCCIVNIGCYVPR